MSTSPLNLDYHRLYSYKIANHYDGLTVADAKTLNPSLAPRSKTDYATTAPEWWKSVNIPAAYSTNYYDFPDQYHTQYSNANGICGKTRVFAYETASCSWSSKESAEWTIKVKPTNPAAPVVVGQDPKDLGGG